MSESFLLESPEALKLCTPGTLAADMLAKQYEQGRDWSSSSFKWLTASFHK